MNNKSNSCPKSGIKIHESNNNYKINSFSSNNPYSRNYKNENIVNNKNIENTSLDLNIDSYSLTDLFKLFGIKENLLTEELM